VYDAVGHLVRKERVRAHEQLILERGTLPNGMYVLKVALNDRILVAPFVAE